MFWTGRADGVTKEPFLFFGVGLPDLSRFSLVSAFVIDWLERRSNRGLAAGGRPMETLSLVAELPGSWLSATRPSTNYGCRFVDGLRRHDAARRHLGAARCVLALRAGAGAALRRPMLRAIAYAYIYFFRGTPLLAQLFLVYYGVGAVPGRRSRPSASGASSATAFYCAVFAFALNTARLPGRDPARRASRSVPRGHGRRRGARPALAADAVEGHLAAGADRGAAAARQRAHPDDQGIGGRLASSRSTT